MRQLWDRVGISASLLCVLHCMFTPLLVLSMPVVGEFWSHTYVHLAILIVVIPVAVWALWNGYRLHRHTRVLWLGGLGIAMILAAMTVGDHNQWVEVIGMIIAGLLLASAHFFNLRSCQTHTIR